MKILYIWIIAGILSYFITNLITQNFIYSLVISTILFYLFVFYIKKWLNGEI